MQNIINMINEYNETEDEMLRDEILTIGGMLYLKGKVKEARFIYESMGEIENE